MLQIQSQKWKLESSMQFSWSFLPLFGRDGTMFSHPRYNQRYKLKISQTLKP
jgi:hypothetical protein